jgi:hypothetical protein
MYTKSDNNFECQLVSILTEIPTSTHCNCSDSTFKNLDQWYIYFEIYTTMCDSYEVWSTVTKCQQPEFQLGHILKLHWSQIQQVILIIVTSKQLSVTVINGQQAQQMWM